jgi:hypothetical protein
LVHSFERARQEPNDSTAVYSVEDADIEDGEDADLKDGEDGEDVEDADLEDAEDANLEDADLEDGLCRRAVLLAKRHREAPPTTLALLHRQMVHGRMERRHAKTKRVAHQEREDGTKMAHDIDVGPFGASNDNSNDSEAAV